MGLFARLLGRKPYPKSPLLEQAMRAPEPAPEPQGVWVPPVQDVVVTGSATLPEGVIISVTSDISGGVGAAPASVLHAEFGPGGASGGSSDGNSGGTFYGTFTAGCGGAADPLPTSEFLRRVAHPDKRDRLIEWMEAAANGTVQRDGKGRFVKRKPGGAP